MARLKRRYDLTDVDPNDDTALDRALAKVVEFPGPRARSGSQAVNLEVALDYARVGIPIFPCDANKRPIGGILWRSASTCDQEMVERWWRRWPAAIPAIDLAKSRLIVIDCDRHGGPDGVAAFDSMTDENGGLPDGAPITVTQSGGLHYFFRQPDGAPLGNRTGSLPAGIDVRGNGGYVIAPGAILPDGRGWQSAVVTPDLPEAFAEGSIPVIPTWLADVIRSKREREATPEPEARQQPPLARQGGNDDARGRAYALATLEGVAAELAGLGRGGRNIALNSSAMRLGALAARGWLTKQEARDALQSSCVANGVWKDDGPAQFRNTFESGFGAGLRKPAADPVDSDIDTPEDLEAIEIGRKIVEARKASRETVTIDGVKIDAETGEVIEGAGPQRAEGGAGSHNEAQSRQGKQRGVDIQTINAADLAWKPVPYQRWHVDDLIPADNVTLLSGDGATGKSLLGLQLAVATATGGDWVGFKPQPGRAVLVSAEDEVEELHRRLDNMTPRLETLGRLTIVPLAGKDAVLAAPGRDGLLHPTPLFGALKHIIQAHRPDLLVLDTLADLFGGDENKKVHARQFIAMLRGLALELNVTVLLLSHPSQAGLNSGSGMSGNTAWNNSVRSRLYFERRIDKFDGSEDDTDIRVLTTKKANRAASGGQIVVRYSDGVFVREEGVASNSGDLIREAEHVFMTLLAQFEREGRTVSNKASGDYAPRVFAKHPDANGIAKGIFEKAMNRLFASGRIKIGLTKGAPSKQREIIVRSNAPDDDGGSDGDI